MIETDLAYGTDPAQKADIYVPDQPNGAAIVFIHGGGWFRGDKTRDQEIGQLFANAGYTAALINYRLAPAHLFPAAQDDLHAFLAWFAASGFEFDRAKVGLLGASVGGTMAISESILGGQPVVTWSAVVDFANWVQQHQTVKASADAKQELGLTEPHAVHESFYKFFVQNYLGDLTPARLTAVNPLNHLSEKLGPTLMYNSTDELVPLPGVFRFLEQAAAFKRDIAVHVVPGSGHARDYTQFALPGTMAFFSYHLGLDNSL
ncbi:MULTISPECIES: alpha/beta hydrolase [unclassified Lacticaseibacillus]|uniref:alpha/beta hydrolase n=1 Tax=unclassified Lacticaseibacillus TaxID=2759744 RepID=UPI001940AF05|nr:MULTISPECIES: alpha/beta hydrolase [unclassified Lacticaseibacillus]